MVLAIAETLVVFATNGVDIADGRVFEQAREALDAMLDALHRPSVGAVCSTARGGCPR